MTNNTQIPDFEAIVKGFFSGLAHEVGDIAVAFFKEGFDKGGFTDYSFKEWPKRKDTLSHALMQKSFALKESIKVASATADRVEVVAGEGLPYAEIHNTGGIITIKVTDKMRRYFWYMFKSTQSAQWKWMALTKKETLTIRIPQRQYIGDSQTLLNNIDKFIAERIKTVQANMPTKPL